MPGPGVIIMVRGGRYGSVVNDMHIQMRSGEVNRCLQLTLRHIKKYYGFGRHRCTDVW